MSIRLSDFQPALPVERLLSDAAPGADAIPLDVAIVGGGPAGLSAAIRLAQISEKAPLSIGVFEKAAEFGGHSLSGAVVHPVGFRLLFPDIEEDALPFRGRVGRERFRFLTRRRALPLPTPPTMRNRGGRIGSLSEMVRWLAERAEELGVELFPGFAVGQLLMDKERVAGLRTVPAGLRRDGSPSPAWEPPAEVAARVVVLAEGGRGPLGQAVRQRLGIGSAAPEVFALGVKELWRSENPVPAVTHTMGHPLPSSAFGGSFLYPMGEGLSAIGMVVGLDAPAEALNAHRLLQELKEHPFVRPHLEGGECLEWGAKVIPEGGFGAIPERLSAPGALFVGDSASFVDVPSLKGVHYAMLSGVLAADAIRSHLTAGTPLSLYDALVRDSPIQRDLHRTRNMRPAFSRGLLRGVLVSGLATLSGGRLPRKLIRMPPDAQVPRAAPLPAGEEARAPGGGLSKLDGVFRSGNNSPEDMPSHLVMPEQEVPEAAAALWEAMCPAGVYESRDGKLEVHPSNCVDCRAADVLGPRWTPRAGGNGPRWRRM